MRWVLGAAALLLAGAALWLWGMGGAQDLARWAADSQREVQNAMAGMLRRLRAGDGAALAGLWGLCFAYGFFHAVGPGHGKLLIGGYGLGRRIAALKLAGLAVTSSLAQAATAVGLVYAGVWLFNLTRTQITGLGEDILAPASYAAIALIGLWLAGRGARRLWRQRARIGPDHTHDHHGAGVACSQCGHSHGPTPDEAAQVHSWRDALALVLAVAIRPCTGALFLLILTWRMELHLAGIVGAFVMGLGTATISLGVAVASVTMREGVLAQMGRSPAARLAVPLIEIAAGAMIALITLQLILSG